MGNRAPQFFLHPAICHISFLLPSNLSTPFFPDSTLPAVFFKLQSQHPPRHPKFSGVQVALDLNPFVAVGILKINLLLVFPTLFLNSFEDFIGKQELALNMIEVSRDRRLLLPLFSSLLGKLPFSPPSVFFNSELDPTTLNSSPDDASPVKYLHRGDC